MKKIAILLLSVFSSFLVVADSLLLACKQGVDARNKETGSVQLLVTGDEQTIDGQNACKVYDNLYLRAACIFGYNTIIPMMFNGSTSIPGNGCNPGNMFNKPCPEEWDRKCDGSDATCCVCGYENESTSPKQEVYGVCKYGKAIGWNLSRVTKSTLGDYFYNGTTRDYKGNPINAIGMLWGVNKNQNTPPSYVNWLNYIMVYVNHIKQNGDNSIFSEPVVTISGADAVGQAS